MVSRVRAWLACALSDLRHPRIRVDQFLGAGHDRNARHMKDLGWLRGGGRHAVLRTGEISFRMGTILAIRWW